MSNQRKLKKSLMKFRKLGTKKLERFFSKGKQTGIRITSMIGVHKFALAPGKACKGIKR